MLPEKTLKESRKTSLVLAWLAVLLALIHMAPTLAVAQEPSADVRARSTEQQMTDDERFSLVISLSGSSRFTGGRDKRYPVDAPSTAGCTPGVPRLGVPALLSSDASMGVTNPGFLPDDKGATALPASIVVGASFNPQLARGWWRARARGADPGLQRDAGRRHQSRP